MKTLDSRLVLQLSRHLQARRARHVRAFVTFDGPGAGRQSQEMLAEVAEELSGRSNIRQYPWRMDWLENPDLADLIQAEALAADVLVIALENTRLLPVTLCRCLAKWSEVKSGRPAELVVLFADPSGTADHARKLEQQLREFAHAAEIEFFSSLAPLRLDFEFQPKSRFTTPLSWEI